MNLWLILFAIQVLCSAVALIRERSSSSSTELARQLRTKSTGGFAFARAFLLVPQRRHRIYTHRSSSWDPARGAGYHAEQNGDRA